MRPILLCAGLATALAISHPALSRPHIFAEARLDVVVGADGAVESLRHLWRFDDHFSTEVLAEFDQDMDLALSEAELHEVADTISASIAEFGYFQLVTADGKKVEMQPPAKFIADYRDEQLMILFESKPKETLRLAGKIAFAVYDPTFYTAIDFAEDEHMAVENLPAGCTRDVIRPDPDKAIEQYGETLAEAFFSDPGGDEFSRIFATRLELTCGS